MKNKQKEQEEFKFKEKEDWMMIGEFYIFIIFKIILLDFIFFFLFGYQCLLIVIKFNQFILVFGHFGCEK